MRQRSGNDKEILQHRFRQLLVTVGVLSSVHAWFLVRSGGLLPSDRVLGTAMVATLFLASGLGQHGIFDVVSFSRTTITSFLLLLATVCAQLTPLPLSVIWLLSPKRAEIAEDVLHVSHRVRWSMLSLYPDMTLLELITALSCVLTFLLIRNVTGKAINRWLMVGPLIVLGIAQATVGLIQAFTPSGPSTATGSFLNRNSFASFLEMLLPFTLIGGWRVLRSGALLRWPRYLVAALLWTLGIYFGAAIFYTYSRMGSLVTVALFITSIGILFRSQAYIPRSPTRKLLVCSLAALPLVCLIAPRRLITRFDHASATDRASNQMRLGFWNDSWSIVSDYPVTGSGLGTFEVVYPRYQTTGTAYRIEYAHNEVFQALVELGIPGFFFATMLLWDMLRQVLSGTRSPASESSRLLGIASLLSLGGMLLHCTVDFNLHIPVNALTFSWILGVGSAPNYRLERSSELI